MLLHSILVFLLLITVAIQAQKWNKYGNNQQSVWCSSLGYFYPDLTNRCRYLECVYDTSKWSRSQQLYLKPISRPCAPGSGVPLHYKGGRDNPCTVRLGQCTAFPPTKTPPTLPTTTASTTTTSTTTQTTSTTTTASTSTAPVTPSSTTTTLSTTTESQFNLKDSGCPYPFIKHSGYHIPGGILVESAETEATCKEYCLGMTDPFCTAIDFNNGDNRCYVFTRRMQRMVKSLNEVNHFQRTTCSELGGAPGGYISCSAGYHVLDGAVQPSIRSITSCQVACLGHAQCEAMDYNFLDELCYFHYANTSCSPMINKPVCTHCKTKKCDTNSPGDEPPSGYSTESVGYHIQGGFEQQLGLTQSECLDSCMNAGLGSCLGVDYNKIDGSCWHHDGRTECRDLTKKDVCTHWRRLPVKCSA